MPKGFISSYNSNKRFGFIKCYELNNNSIYFHFSNLNVNYKHTNVGDKVEFDYVIKNDGENFAKSIQYLGNQSLDCLKIDFKNGISLKGF
jgi:cold shock CspA family protein